MAQNPYDPRKRTDLSRRQQILLQFTAEVVHGTNTSLIDTLVAPNYLQHTHGSGRAGRAYASMSARYRLTARVARSGGRSSSWRTATS
jgi:hypothetical protein